MAYPAGGPWRFEAITSARVTSKVAAADLFAEVSVPAGVAAQIPAYGTPGNSGFVWKGAAAGDVDGDLDVFIGAVGTQVLLENRLVPDGKLSFEDVSQEHGVGVPAVGFSVAAADVNADGRPDIYVCSYNEYGRVTPDSWSAATNGTPNLFFVSQPDGGYREEAAKWGVADRRWSYAAAFADFDEDGQLDLHVTNMSSSPGARASTTSATVATPSAASRGFALRTASSPRSSGVDLVGLSLDIEPDADVARFAREAGVTYPIYRGRADAVEALFTTNQLSVPLSVLVDEHGTVAQIIDGWSERTRKAFERLATAR